jgi:hypothetical protein
MLEATMYLLDITKHNAIAVLCSYISSGMVT